MRGIRYLWNLLRRLQIKRIYQLFEVLVIKINPPAPLIKDIDALPLFPYHLVDVPKYSTLNINNLPSLDILTSRGCPYNCGFCSTPATSQRLWRPLSVGRIIENIILLKERY